MCSIHDRHGFGERREVMESLLALTETWRWLEVREAQELRPPVTPIEPAERFDRVPPAQRLRPLGFRPETGERGCDTFFRRADVDDRVRPAEVLRESRSGRSNT